MSEIKPVSISYSDFKAGKDFTEELSEAFGANGLGLIVVRDFPDFQKERQAALRAIRKFADLPEETKEEYTDSKSNYRLVTCIPPYTCQCLNNLINIRPVFLFLTSLICL